MAQAKKQTQNRSAVSGRYVTERFAKQHPKTTVKEVTKVVKVVKK